MHITIDGYGGDPTKLADVDLVRNLLDRYPGEIGMTKISKPFSTRYQGEKPDDWGVSGFVIIAESHIAIHTFPVHRQVWVDVFSCKEIEEKPSVNFIVEAFDLEEYRLHILHRGIIGEEYPHDVEASVRVNRIEREALTSAGRHL